jgi:hypothetical protein
MAVGGGLQKAAGVLAAADAVAHVAFLGIFGWRMFTGGIIGKYVSLVLLVAAAIGLLLGVIGWLLMKHAPMKRLKTVGVWGIGLSTGLAGILLFAASWTSG